MNILFDENFPRPLRRFFPEHQVTTVQKMEWLEAENGDLLAVAEAETGRTIAVITLRAFDNRIETLTPLMPKVLALLPSVQPGQVYVVEA